MRGDRVAFRLGDGRMLELGKDDPQLRHLDHAWASTVRAYQGRTVDNVIAVMEAKHPKLSTQKSFYVEISRARHNGEPVTDDANALRETLEPDEQHPGDEPDDVALGRAFAGPVVGEAARGNRPLEPAEQVAVEAPVQRLDIEHALPGGVQVVEITNACLDKAGQGEVAEDRRMPVLRLRPLREAANPLGDRRIEAAQMIAGAGNCDGVQQGQEVRAQPLDQNALVRRTAASARLLPLLELALSDAEQRLCVADLREGRRVLPHPGGAPRRRGVPRAVPRYQEPVDPRRSAANRHDQPHPGLSPAGLRPRAGGGRGRPRRTTPAPRRTTPRRRGPTSR